MKRERAPVLHRASNQLIKRGFQVHKVGKRTKQAGIGVAGVGGAAVGTHAGAMFVASGGAVPSYMQDVGRQAANLWDVSGIERRIPAIGAARRFLGPHTKRFTKAAQDWAWKHRAPNFGASWFEKGVRLDSSSRLGAAAESVRRAAVSHRFVPRGMKAIKYGTGIALAGLGVEKVGSAMVRHGFGSHPGRVKRKLKRFFGMRG